jgi:hypothetical protein
VNLSQNPSDLKALPEWQAALDVADVLEVTCAGLKLDYDREWLRSVLMRVVSELRDSVIWVLEAGSTRADRSDTEARADFVVAADAARGSAVLASYCLDFMSGENLITQDIGELSRHLLEVEAQLRSLAQRLRQSPPTRHRFAQN